MMKKWRLIRVLPIYFGQAFSAIIPLVLAPIIIRKGGLGVYGVYASLLTASQIGIIISEYSFEALGPRLIIDIQDNESEGSRRIIYFEVLIAKMMLAVAGVIIGIFSARMMLARMPTIFEAFGLFAMMLGTAAYGSWYLLATGKLMMMSVLIVVSRALTIILMLLIINSKYSLDGAVLFLVYVIPWAMMGAVVAIKTVPRNIVLMNTFKRSIVLIKMGRHSFLGMSGGALQNVLASLLIGVFSGPVALGAYNAIDRIARTASAALKPIFQTLYPHMALLHKKDKLNAKRVMTKYLVIVIVLILFVISLSVPISKYLIYYIYGAKLISYSSLLIILLVWLSFGIINNMIGIQGLLASGRDVEYTIGIWICVITSIVTGLLSVGKQDFIYWVGASVALGELLALIYYFYSYYKHLPNEKIIKVHEKEGDSLGVYRSVV